MPYHHTDSEELQLTRLTTLQSLIQRSYRDDIPSSAIERFLPLVLEQEEEGTYVTPCFSNGGINYLHIRHNNLYRQSCLTSLHRVVFALAELS